MGTRADFYIRNENKEPKMEWLGSIAWDGYSIDGVEKATTEKEYRELLTAFLKERDDATFPENGWPWPWNNSCTTDYAYIFENGKVMASCFGYELFDPMKEQSENEDDEQRESKMKDYFPDMSHLKNTARGKRSGTIVVGIRNDGSFSVE